LIRKINNYIEKIMIQHIPLMIGMPGKG